MNGTVEDALRVLIEYGLGSTDPEVQEACSTVSDYLNNFN